MRIWSHTYLRRGCGAALITMAAVQAGVFWRDTSPHPPALEPLPPLQLIASTQDEPSVVPAQFAVVRPASRIPPASQMAHRLPPVQIAVAPRRLPPVSPPKVARRLPPVTIPTKTPDELAVTIAPKAPDVTASFPRKEIERVGPQEGGAPATSLTLAAPQLVQDKRDETATSETPVHDQAKSEATPSLAKKSEPTDSAPLITTDDCSSLRPVQRPFRAVANQCTTRRPGRAVVPEPAVSDVLRSEDRTQKTTATTDPDDPLRLIPHPLQPDWKKTGSTLSVADRQADELVRNAAALARRGATYSSRRELESALVVLAQALDSHYETTGFTQCLRRGLLALEEADDFVPNHARGQLNLDPSLIVSRHRSGVVSPDETKTSTPTEIARKYEIFAKEHLAAACGNSPVAAHALFGMGKVYSKMSEDSAKGKQFGQRAMLLHRTALKVDRTHSPAATELGTLLARAGRLQEAREVLIHGLTGSKSPETWRQLANVHGQLGENLLANQARAEAERIAQVSRNADPNTVIAPNGTTVKWVDVATFQGVGRPVPSNGVRGEDRLQQAASSPTANPTEIPRTAAQPRRLIRSW